MFLTLSTQLIKRTSRARNAICFCCFMCRLNRFFSSRDFKAETSNFSLLLHPRPLPLLCNYFSSHSLSVIIERLVTVDGTEVCANCNGESHERFRGTQRSRKVDELHNSIEITLQKLQCEMFIK